MAYAYMIESATPPFFLEDAPSSLTDLTIELTMLKPSMSASLTHLSNSSATWAAVPTTVAPRPPTVICWATVIFVHLATPGADWDQASTADLMRVRIISKRLGKVLTGWHCSQHVEALHHHCTLRGRPLSIHQRGLMHLQLSPEI